MTNNTQLTRASNPMMEVYGNSNPQNMIDGRARVGADEDTQAAIISSGEIARVQSQVILAKKFPRNECQSVEHILNVFSRPALAESALYQYQRGGTDILGLSIRAAEAMAQAWGNIDFGFREIENKDGYSTVETYAWDLETNVRRVQTFKVPHVRDTKKGRVRLEDSRDIYELVANNSARRVRACILAVIPKDVQDSAMEQVNITLSSKVDISPERIKKMVAAFGEIGVSKNALEGFIQRRIDTIQPAQMLRLMRIFNSIRDGMSAVEDWFDVSLSESDVKKEAIPEKKTLASLAQKNAETKELKHEMPKKNEKDETIKHTEQDGERIEKSLDALLVKSNAPVSAKDIKLYCEHLGIAFDANDVSKDINGWVNKVLEWHDSVSGN